MRPELVLPHPLSNLRDRFGRPSGRWLRDRARPSKDNPHPMVVFLGESGAGKSTNAALLAEDADDHGVPVIYSRYEVAIHKAELRLGMPRADWGKGEYSYMSGGFYQDITDADEERIKSYPNSLHIIETISTVGDDFLDRAVSVAEVLAINQRYHYSPYQATFALINADPHLQRKSMILRLKVPGIPKENVPGIPDEEVIDYLRNEHNIEIVGAPNNAEGGRFVKSLYEAQAIPARLYAITDQYIEFARRWARRQGYIPTLEKAETLWVPNSVSNYDLPDPYQLLVPGAFVDRTPELQHSYRLKSLFAHSYMIRKVLHLPHTMARALHNGFDLSRVVRWDVTHYRESQAA